MRPGINEVAFALAFIRFAMLTQNHLTMNATCIKLRISSFDCKDARYQSTGVVQTPSDFAWVHLPDDS